MDYKPDLVTRSVAVESGVGKDVGCGAVWFGIRSFDGRREFFGPFVSRTMRLLLIVARF